MTTAVLATYGHYTPHHTCLKKMGFRPSDRDVFAKIASLALNAGEVFISLRAFSQELGYTRETICRSIKRLAAKERIKLTTKKKYGFFPVVKVLPIPEQSQIISTGVPLTKRSTVIDQTINANCADGQHIINNEHKLKQQQLVAEKNPEKKTALAKLKSFGISSNESKRLMGRFPLERIDRQIEILNQKLKINAGIKNQAGWLIKAIRENYRPKVLDEQKQSTDEFNRRANQMAQDADMFLSMGKPEEAIKLAENSIAIHENTMAKDVIEKAKTAIIHNMRREKALAAISPDIFAQILAEEENKQKESLLRLGIKKFGEMSKIAAYHMALERAVAMTKSLTIS
jgi:hypothetical protein